jgi:hypothetical protein
MGVDFSLPYLRDQARGRLGLAALAEWEDGRRAEAAWEGMPLFRAADVSG